MNKIVTWIIVAFVIIIVGGLFWLMASSDASKVTGTLTLQQLSEKTGCQLTEPAQPDAFAKCLKESGAVFYGAFWCSHCQEQKALFGDSAQYLPYVECSTADGKAQLQACADQKIQVYPTWRFK
ncbi:MAG: hypothetical protein EXS52_00865 [Candidatus Staskawiczbacteria bacterium]|nr:hypothetical protein [Candidatus Staskawiczbacteria bacterium]